MHAHPAEPDLPGQIDEGPHRLRHVARLTAHQHYIGERGRLPLFYLVDRAPGDWRARYGVEPVLLETLTRQRRLITAQRTGMEISQGFTRSLDRKVRMRPTAPLKEDGLTYERLKALVSVACQLLNEGAPDTPINKLHRLDKADTKGGPESLRMLAGIGVPYAMLLYERFLGRPFAGHRDSVSELVGDSLESVIEDVLSKAGISYRKTKRAERVPGFDQAPDFIIPSEYNPQVVIEAKLTEDDGTARDKVTRVQHLHSLSIEGRPTDDPKFEVIACIAGRGFGVRREDMKKSLLATKGKVFTLKTMDQLVEHSLLRQFRTKAGESMLAKELDSQ
jgi:hypothetical protein